MDPTEANMKFVGFFGIFNQSFKTIFKLKIIFAQITLSLLLPLIIIFLAHIQIDHHLFSNIEGDSIPYVTTSSRRSATAADWLYYWLFEIAYLIFFTFFSLLATAAVVFTIATSVYTDREVVFRQVLKIVPKVWKKLFVTFAFIYFALFIYNVITGVVTVIVRSIFGYSIFGVILMIIVLISYVYGFLYLSVVWQLASVVPALENLHGFKAMKKGKHLLKGKKMVGMGIAFVLYVVLIGLILVYMLFVEYGDEVFNLAMIWRVLIGILTGILIMKLFLMMIVAQTVLYLVCKSYHNEAIDKVRLLTFLGASAEETAVSPKHGEGIQLEAHPPPPLQQV